MKSKQTVRQKNYDLRLILGVSILIAVILMLIGKTKELGTNLFTEITGVAITVFVINKILERKDRQKRISIDQRILRELQSIIASYFSIWKHIAWKYIPHEKIENPSDLYRIYPQLVSLTNMKDQFEVVSIHHPESWKLFFHNRTIKDCFENYYTTLTGVIQLLINDFKMFLEPELLNRLLDIMESSYCKNIVMMGQEGTEKILIELELDADRLESYLNHDDIEHLQHFLALIDYSNRLHQMIDKFTDVNVELYDIKKYFMHPSKFAQ